MRYGGMARVRALAVPHKWGTDEVHFGHIWIWTITIPQAYLIYTSGVPHAYLMRYEVWIWYLILPHRSIRYVRHYVEEYEWLHMYMMHNCMSIAYIWLCDVLVCVCSCVLDTKVGVCDLVRVCVFMSIYVGMYTCVHEWVHVSFVRVHML